MRSFRIPTAGAGRRPEGRTAEDGERGGRGQALGLLGLAFARFLARMALAIDRGNALIQRRWSQSAADAAALCGTWRL
jgi:hypothetical protein